MSRYGTGLLLGSILFGIHLSVILLTNYFLYARTFAVSSVVFIIFPTVICLIVPIILGYGYSLYSKKIIDINLCLNTSIVWSILFFSYMLIAKYLAIGISLNLDLVLQFLFSILLAALMFGLIWLGSRIYALTSSR